jgi:uncharacterized cupredoxin-like copper-binding protein
VLGSALLLVLGACGADGDSKADHAEACDAWFAADSAVIHFLFAGEGDATSVNAMIDAAIVAAPSDFKATLTELKSEAAPQLSDPSSKASDKTLQLYSDSIAWAGDNCDVKTIDVTAKDYMYQGIPTELSTGYQVVNFANKGTEHHEMFAFRINDGVTESAQELLALSEDEVFSKITPVNAIDALPGTSATVSWDLPSAGKYAVVCFISQGSVGETEGTGAPHVTLGMIHEFTVK